MQSFLISGGPIHTMVDGDAGSVQAVLTRGDAILFAGSAQQAGEIASREGLDPTVVDLQGRALLPGFIDGHMHPLPMIFFALGCNLDNARGLGEVRQRLEAQRDTLAPDEWLFAVQFENNKLASGEELTRRELTDWFPDVPVLVYARDGHSVILNDAALACLPGPDEMIEVEGGSIGRFEDGTLDGRFYEKAIGIPMGNLPAPSIERMVGAAQGVFASLTRAGITSLGVMLQSDEEGPGGSYSENEYRVIEGVRGLIPQSIYSIVIGKTLDGLNALIDGAMNDPANATNARAFKIFADGTFGSCTACMTEPYADRTCTHGYMTLGEDEIYRRMEHAHCAGYQICIHAVGDRGIENCVRLFERLLEEHPRDDHRHRIEHASIADRELVERIARAGLHICTQPLFIRSERAWLPTRLGEERAGRAYPFRDYIDAGINLAFSSDAPIEDPDVIAALDFAVNRGGFHPEQGVTVKEALRAYTVNAARLQFEEDRKGSIEAGKLADFVVLDRDPLAIAPVEIGDVQVCATFIRGALAYQNENSGVDLA